MNEARSEFTKLPCKVLEQKIPAGFFISSELKILLQNLSPDEKVVVIHPEFGRGILVLRDENEGVVVKVQFGNRVKIIDRSVVGKLSFDTDSSTSKILPFINCLAEPVFSEAERGSDAPVPPWGKNPRLDQATARAMYYMLADASKLPERRESKFGEISRLLTNLFTQNRHLKLRSPDNDHFYCPCSDRDVLLTVLRTAFLDVPIKDGGIGFKANKLSVILRQALTHGQHGSIIEALENSDHPRMKMGPFGIFFPSNNSQVVIVANKRASEKF